MKRRKAFIHTSDTDGLSWSIVDQDSGMILESFATEEEADAALAPPTPDGMLPYESYSKGYWRGVAAVENVETGDGRMFSPGALVWRDLPLPMYWQEKTAEGHDASFAVGKITEMERDGDLIRDAGQFDMEGEHGREAHRLAYQQVIRGQSVSLDDISDNDIELVWPDDAMQVGVLAEDEEPVDPEEEDAPAEDPEEEDPPMAPMFAEPKMTIFHHGRVMDVNFTGTPAMQEAFLELVPDAEIDNAQQPDDTMPIVASLSLPSRSTFRVVAPHDTATVDGPWDGGAEEIKLQSPFPLSVARGAYAWFDESRIANDEIPRSACRFIHHEVSADGSPGAANLTACSSAIGVLNGARGGTTIPASDRQGVYNHLAGHIRDAGREPPELLTVQEIEFRAQRRALSAAATMVNPPRAWFANPRLTEATPWTVENNGQCFGHAALWGVCHVGFPGTCVTPPHENDYGFFTTGEILTAEGDRIPVGKITLGANHAPTSMGARPAIEHYENTGFVAADVACGADRFGIWVAGAVRPELTDAQLRSLRAAAISGDWRTIRGRLRTIGMLMVNVPGFPIPRTRTYARNGVQTALVASGIVQRREPVVSKSIINALAASIGRDPISRANELRKQIHPSVKE